MWGQSAARGREEGECAKEAGKNHVKRVRGSSPNGGARGTHFSDDRTNAGQLFLKCCYLIMIK
jgi:hypothetical protein